MQTAAAVKVNPAKMPNPFLVRFANQTIWHIVLLVLLPFFVYIKTAGFEFINLDDIAIIKNNYLILSNFHNIGLAFKTDAFLSIHGDFYRPVQTISFMLDAYIGGERPLIYHLSNLLYHIITVVSLYFFLRSVAIKQLTALFGALLFSVHPLLSADVSWVPARGDVLMCLFALLQFIVFDKYFRSGRKFYIILYALLFFLGIFSKEVAILLPVLLLFYYFFIFQQVPGKRVIHIKRLLPFLFIWVGGMAFFLLLRNKVVITIAPDFIVGINPFLKNLPAIPIILCKFFVPANLSTMPLFDSHFTIAGCCILLFILFLVIKNAFKKKWLITMGFAWFLIFIIPPMFFKLFYSNFLIEYYEHRSYLPIVGLIIMLTFLLNDTLFKSSNRFLNWSPVLVILLFTFLASAHSDHFKNSLSFFGRAAELGNPGAATKRGEMYFDQRDFPNALVDFENAIELSGGEYPPALFDRGNYNATVLKDHKAAENDYTGAINLDAAISGKLSPGQNDPMYVEALIKRANERIFTQNIQGALNDLEKAKQIDSSNPKIYFVLGSAYVNTTGYRDAISAFSKSIALNSDNYEAYNNRGFSFYKIHNYDSAMRDYTKAIDLFPEYLNARYNKGMIYFETGRPDSAIKQFDTTLILANNFYFGYFYRGMAKKQKNDIAGACGDWQESVKLGFTMAQDTINRYCK